MLEFFSAFMIMALRQLKKKNCLSDIELSFLTLRIRKRFYADHNRTIVPLGENPNIKPLLVLVLWIVHNFNLRCTCEYFT